MKTKTAMIIATAAVALFGIYWALDLRWKLDDAAKYNFALNEYYDHCLPGHGRKTDWSNKECYLVSKLLQVEYSLGPNP